MADSPLTRPKGQHVCPMQNVGLTAVAGRRREGGVSHHSDEVAPAVLPHQLLLPVGLADDRAQTPVQHDVGAVRLVVLPGKREDVKPPVPKSECRSPLPPSPSQVPSPSHLHLKSKSSPKYQSPSPQVQVKSQVQVQVTFTSRPS